MKKMNPLRRLLNELLGYPRDQGDGASPDGSRIVLPAVSLGSSMQEVATLMQQLNVDAEDGAFRSSQYGDDYRDRTYWFHPNGSPALVPLSYSYRVSSGRIFRIGIGSHRNFFDGQIGALCFPLRFDEAVRTLGVPTHSLPVAPVRDEHWWLTSTICHHLSCYSKDYDDIVGLFPKGEIDRLAAWQPSDSPPDFNSGLTEELQNQSNWGQKAPTKVPEDTARKLADPQH